MIGGMWNGYSGINTYEKALSTETNNASNTNTPGYKSSDVRFEDMIYRESQAGFGVGIENVYKRFVQGDIKVTGHSFDVGIEGPGYFHVKEPETNESFYTRAGNFKMDEGGFLSTVDGLKVQGLTPPAPTVVSSDPNTTKFTSKHSNFIASESIFSSRVIDGKQIETVETINTRASDYSKAKASGVNGEGYKSASAKRLDVEAAINDYKNKINLYRSVSTQDSTPSLAQITNLDFRSFLSELKDKNDYLKVTIGNQELRQQFDTDIETTMRNLADKISNIQGLKGSIEPTAGVLKIESLIPAKEITIYDAAVNDKAATVTQVQGQKLGTGYGIVESSRASLKSALEAAGAELIDIRSRIVDDQATLQNSNDIKMKLVDLGLSEFAFGNVSIEEGIVYLADGNNKFVVGKLQTSFFRNDQGLDPRGDNLYKATADAGEPQNAGRVNILRTKSLELSNTNNTTSMTNLITYQRAFEANSKSITTSDDLLRTAIQLKK